MSYQPIDRCRSCAGAPLLPVLDLGEQPLANSYPVLADDSAEVRYPLAVVRCPHCTLVQLAGTIDPRLMFDDYPYFSSYSTTMTANMRDLAARVTSDLALGSDDLVVEIASNDGYLLRHYISLGVPVLGVEPARNIAQVAESCGVPTLVEYFSAKIGDRLAQESSGASVVHANNVMAHVPDINDFVAGIKRALRPSGVAIIESPYLGRMIEDCEFDTIYHEHVFYYSLTAVDTLARRHGLMVVDVEPISIHGGSLRYFMRHADAGEPSEEVRAWLLKEEDGGVREASYYEGFAGRVGAIRAETLAILERERAAGRRIAAYGAAAKGTVLLNHFGIGPELVEFVVDRNPHKQGHRMPGVGIPIVAPEALTAEMPDLVLLLAWNFADEILDQQRAYREAGGRFLVPIPDPRIV